MTRGLLRRFALAPHPGLLPSERGSQLSGSHLGVQLDSQSIRCMDGLSLPPAPEGRGPGWGALGDCEERDGAFSENRIWGFQSKARQTVKKRVLLVDDDPAIREAVGSVLTGE